METPTDMEIVRRVQAGDAEAFGELVNRYSGRIYALALAMVRDAQRAEDVTQEAFIRAYEHLDGFRGASAFGTWLYRIAYNRAAGECRRRAYDRAIAAMACYCAVAVAAVMAVAFVCLRSVDSPEGALQVLAILAGAVAAMMVACGDRATEILHRL